MKRIRLAQINLPSHAAKTQLVAPRDRGEFAELFLAQHEIDWSGFVELWSGNHDALLRRSSARLVTAPPNQTFSGNKIGNGQWSNRDTLRRKGRTKSFRVPYPGHPLGLNMPVQAFHTVKDDKQFDAVTVHSPTMKTDAKTNRLTLDTTIEFCHDLHARHKGRPVILSADLNDGNGWKELEREGFTVGAHNGVDVIAGIGVDSWSHAEVHETNVRGRWTDHAVLTVRAALL